MTSPGQRPQVVFPRVRRPAASVVVVTFGELKWTRRSLEFLRKNTEPHYEVIVVDNRSRPEAVDFLRCGIANSTVELNRRNLGFGAASNQGAALARGRYLVFLNNDALVHAGWLPPLLARLDDGRIGAVGPKLLNLDGSLQAAGALLARSGSTLEYGFGQDPARSEFNFPRVVDYVSGCCLAVGRSAFEEVGGFHPAYGPGYFEDADLCLSLRARGSFTVYEPAASVTHVRGASGSAQLEPELPLRNRAIFERRWRRVLRDRPHSPLASSVSRVVAARDAPALHRRLVLCEALPPPGRIQDDLFVRTTIAVTEPPSEELVEAWLQRGVEVASSGSPGLLRSRRFLYDEVLVEAPMFNDGLLAELDWTQPQARRVVIEHEPGDSLRLGRLVGDGARGRLDEPADFPAHPDS